MNTRLTKQETDSLSEYEKLKSFLNNSSSYQLLKDLLSPHQLLKDLLFASNFFKRNLNDFVCITSAKTFAELDNFFKEKFQKVDSSTHRLTFFYKIDDNFRYTMYHLWMEYETYKTQDFSPAYEQKLKC